MMNKKGAELTLNTVIVGILVVLVLIVVITFFLGGTSGLTRTIRGIFYGTTAGTSETIAVQSCQNRCDQALLLPTAALRKASAFCMQPFELDKNNDGEADYTLEADGKKTYTKFYCYRELSVSCDFNCDDGRTTAEKQAATSTTTTTTPPSK